ncbi:MAG: LuxR C-terminal-related transcriptional regulator [Anaerolineaceae bacterium]|nr:LuxR C-terminal-related transcriptional regulator [Anaerolineaceae bacterium]
MLELNLAQSFEITLPLSTFPLLSTKTNLPAGRPSLIQRPRLLNKLDLSLLPGNRLTLLSAPAGFGKTTLVIDWQRHLAGRSVSLAWFSIDARDNDLVRFLHYFVAALQIVQPEIGQTSLAVLDLPQTADIESLVIPLINEISEFPGQMILVLDDYQEISNPEIHQALDFLLDHQPPQFHLIIVTRQDPNLPMARLRARAQLNEIRSQELCFTLDEALDFIKCGSSLMLTSEQAAVLQQNTEGWAAGLQIAGLSLQSLARHQAEPAAVDQFLASFNGSHQYVFDYLAQEVIDRQDAGIIDFLHQTSILEQLNPALCDALTGRTDSERILKELDQSNLFILPLDERRQWYRYHHLFAEFLQTGLASSVWPDLYNRAAGWFEQNGMVEQAVFYALKAGSWDHASRLIRQLAGKLIKQGELSALLSWIDALPPAVLQADADLCIYKGWISLLRNSMGITGTLAAQAEKVICSQDSAATHGRLLGLKAYLAYAGGDTQAAARFGSEAVNRIGHDDPYSRKWVLAMLGGIQRQSGSVPAAIRAFEDAILTSETQAEWGIQTFDIGLAILQSNLQIAYSMHAERRRAIAYSTDLIRQYTGAKGQLNLPAVFLLMPLAGLYYEGNELEAGLAAVQQGLQLCHKMGVNPTVIGGMNTLAVLQFRMGEPDLAMQTIQTNIIETRQLQLPWIAGMAKAVKARLDLILGNMAAAVEWAKNAQLPPITTPDAARMTEQLTQAHLFLAQNDYKNAYTLLSGLQTLAEQCERYQNLIEIDILLAVTCLKLGNQDEALATFEKAVLLAAPQGIIRPLIDIETFDLVSRLRQKWVGLSKNLPIAFLDQILAITSPETTATARIMGKPAPPKTPSLFEPLSPRELDVMRLMAEGLSNAEIARRLFLTTNTLKAHTNSIYGKLDVHSRMQAVIRARQIGLLPPFEN